MNLKQGEKMRTQQSMLCAIHTHPKYKLIKEAQAWESWLLVRYGVDSCRFLNEAELQEVLDILDSKAPDRDYIQRKGSISAAQRAKIETIMKQRSFGYKAKRGFITRQIGVYKPLWALDKTEASKIITGLQKITGER